MKIKIILSLFIMVMLIGIVLPEGGNLANTTISIGESKDIGNLISNDLIKGTVIVREVEFTKKENENTLIFKKDGRVNIRGDLFENVKEFSSIKLNDEGEIIFANLTASKEAIFNFNGKVCKLLAGENVLYENGELIFDRKAGESIEIKEESSDLFTKITSLGKKISFGKDADGNPLLKGNLKIGNDEFKGLGENNIGKITLSKTTGKISKIWENTDATIDGINHKVSDNLNISYDENFVASSHTNENYFNYGKNSISLGGTGFTSDLGKTNGVFGDMKTTKVVKGIGTKTRDLSITPGGGNLVISKDMTNSNSLSFNINGNGNYVINNSRASISSKEDKMFVKANEDKEGLLYSYDLNINDGKYTLESNFFKDKEGKVLVNTNKPWENLVLVAKGISDDEEYNIRKALNKTGRFLFTDDPKKDYLDWFQQEGGEFIAKKIYRGSEIASKNDYGILVDPEKILEALKAESAGNMGARGNGALYYRLINDPYGTKIPESPEIFGFTYGLHNSGSQEDIKFLKDHNFISDNLNVGTYHGDGYDTPLTLPNDAIEYFCGVWAQKTYYMEEDYKKLYGQEAFYKFKNDKDKYSFFQTVYFNMGQGKGLEKLKDIDNSYVPIWKGAPPGGNNVWKFNARQRTDFLYLLDELGLTDYP